MKKLMAAVLCIALAFSVMSVGVFAEEVVEEATSSVYTINEGRKRVEGVAPFTTVQAFEANWETGDVQVVNVDLTEMDDTAYATDNVYARINGEFYKIDVNWPYDSVQHYGRNYRTDGDVIFTKASANFNSTVDNQPALGNSGFAYATSGYKLGDASGAAPSIPSGCETVITKQTNEVGDPIYVIENNAPRYAFLRSHYIYSTSESNVTALTTLTKGKVSVTTATFKADMMGNFSIHHNAPGYINGSYKSDQPLEGFTYGGYAQYIPNAVHFAQDGTVKIGGTYNNGSSAADRTPGISTNYTWEAGKEYTVSIVQQVRTGADPARYAQVYGVYINGEKVFPFAESEKDGSQFTYLSSTGAYQMKTRGSNYKFTGGISAVLVGAAPANASDDFSVELSDLKVYTVDSAAAYEATKAMDADITLVSADEDIVIDNKAATVVSSLGAVTASRFTMDGYKVAVNGNVLTVVSEDGLTAKKYAVTHGTSIQTGFYNAENGQEIDSADGVEVVGFSAIIDKAVASEFAGITPSVILAVYKNGVLEGFVIADGAVYAGEMTKFTAEYDLSEIESVEGDKFTARAFVWDSADLTPLTESFDI